MEPRDVNQHRAQVDVCEVAFEHSIPFRASRGGVKSFGTTIRMYQNDHAPSHFHATYAGNEAVIEIGTSVVLNGRLPARVLGLVVEWATEHEKDLRSNWQLAREQKPLVSIRPLE